MANFIVDTISEFVIGYRVGSGYYERENRNIRSTRNTTHKSSTVSSNSSIEPKKESKKSTEDNEDSKNETIGNVVINDAAETEKVDVDAIVIENNSKNSEKEKFEIVAVNEPQKIRGHIPDDTLDNYIQKMQDDLELTEDMEKYESKLIAVAIFWMIGSIDFAQMRKRCINFNAIQYIDSLIVEVAMSNEEFRNLRAFDKSFENDRMLEIPDPIPFKQLVNPVLLYQVMNYISKTGSNKDNIIFCIVYNSLVDIAFDLIDQAYPDIKQREEISRITAKIPPITETQVYNQASEQLEDVRANQFVNLSMELKPVLNGLKHSFAPTGMDGSAYLTVYSEDGNPINQFLVDEGSMLGKGPSIALYAIDPNNGNPDTILVLIREHQDIVSKAIREPGYIISTEDLRSIVKDQFSDGLVYQFIDLSNMGYHLNTMTPQDYETLGSNLSYICHLNWPNINYWPRLRFRQYNGINNFTLVSDELVKIPTVDCNHDIVSGLVVRFTNGIVNASINDMTINIQNQMPSWIV